MELNVDLLKRFMKVQKKIESFNEFGFFETLKTSEDELDQLEYLKKQSERDFRVLDEQTRKQKQDCDNIGSKSFGAYFKSPEEHDKFVATEQKVYDKNQKSLKKAEKKLSENTGKYQEALNCLQEFKEKNKKALDLYNEQMNILNSTFDGDYGSDLENELEAAIKEHDKEMIQLKAAINRWNNARFLLIYACNQIQCAEQHWKEIHELDIEDPKIVLRVTESINNILVCDENLEKTQKMLSNVKFPYCTPEEREKIVKLTDCMYTDMLNVQLQVDHETTLSNFHQSCINLKMWFDSVIKKTLVDPYAHVVAECRRVKQELRLERIRLLQEHIKTTLNKEINLETLDKIGADNADSLVEKCNNEDEATKAKLIVDSENTDKMQKVFELPPPPSKEQLLGDIEVIKKEYREQTEGWNKHLEESRNLADDKLKRMLSHFNVKETTVKE